MDTSTLVQNMSHSLVMFSISHENVEADLPICVRPMAPKWNGEAK